MLRSSSNIVKTFIGYAAAEQHRAKYLCFYCGGSLVIESDLENFEYGVVECMLCTRPAAVIKPEDWKKNLALTPDEPLPPVRSDGECVRCGAAIVPTVNVGRSRKYCSRQCKDSLYKQTIREGRKRFCQDCRASIDHMAPRTLFCSPCVRRHDLERKSKWRALSATPS